MKISVLLAFVLAPAMVLTFTGCASAPDDGNEMPNYPVPNKADNAANMQDAHSKFLRNAH